MRKIHKLFFNIKTELEWLSRQKGWKLIQTNGFSFTFEESPVDYRYEYIFFEKSKKELDSIRNQITDIDIEFVCISSSWALFRKDASKGELHVFTDNYIPYKKLMKKYRSYSSLGSCYLCLGSAYIALMHTNALFAMPSVLFYVNSCIYFLQSSIMKNYALLFDNGSFAEMLRRDKS